MKTPQSWVDSYQDFWITGELGLIKAGPSLDRWIEAIQTDARSDLLDRIKVLEVALKKYDDELSGAASGATFDLLKRMKDNTEHLTALLHRCLNTGLRHEADRPLYLEVCRVLGVDPDKPWEEK